MHVTCTLLNVHVSLKLLNFTFITGKQINLKVMSLYDSSLLLTPSGWNIYKKFLLRTAYKGRRLRCFENINRNLP
jgi:hypothetical protein